MAAINATMRGTNIVVHLKHCGSWKALSKELVSAMNHSGHSKIVAFSFSPVNIATKAL